MARTLHHRPLRCARSRGGAVSAHRKSRAGPACALERTRLGRRRPRAASTPRHRRPAQRRRDPPHRPRRSRRLGHPTMRDRRSPLRLAFSRSRPCSPTGAQARLFCGAVCRPWIQRLPPDGSEEFPAPLSTVGAPSAFGLAGCERVCAPLGPFRTESVAVPLLRPDVAGTRCSLGACACAHAKPLEMTSAVNVSTARFLRILLSFDVVHGCERPN